MATVTIKELHATTEEIVRRAGASRSPVVITDRGKPVAVLTNPSLLQPRKRERTLLAGFAAMMSRAAGDALVEDLDAIRDD